MTVNVPSQYQLYVTNAANQLGISPDIVAAQIQTESSWDPTVNSPAGAQGIAQFEPGTWAQYGSGSPYNVSDAFAAYTKYMGALLTQFNGNVRDALAAYNAGPGNLSAGYGYADSILTLAGSGTSTTSTGVSTSAPTSSGGFWPQGIIDFFNQISSPVFWMRTAMVIFGGVLLIVSILNLSGTTHAAIGLDKTAVKAVPK